MTHGSMPVLHGDLDGTVAGTTRGIMATAVGTIRGTTAGMVVGMIRGIMVMVVGTVPIIEAGMATHTVGTAIQMVGMAEDIRAMMVEIHGD